ncbi:MAG: tetratricopeptide repeat protein [Terriglobales bacterium]
MTNLGITYLERHKYQEALPSLEKAASLAPDDASCQVRIGQAYLNLEQDDKAMAAFEKAIKISATPSIWNDIAYQLALKGSHLDLARRYAESAVSGTAARLRNVSLSQLSQRDLGLVISLGSYWDTLGWVAFSEGKLDLAETYVSAAWQLGRRGDEGDHLGQIYEKQGKKQEAERMYALALNARRPEPETRARLAALVGGENKVDAAVEEHRTDLHQERTFKMANSSKLEGSADFFILQGVGPDLGAILEDVAFVNGNEKLKALTDEVRSAKLSQKFPEQEPVKIVRRGILSCKANSDCEFELMLPDDVRSVD